MSATGPFRPVGLSGQMVDRVADQIKELIVSGKLEPGSALPPQGALAQQLGVSRTVIREAMRVLAAKGLLETRRGVGTRVRRVTPMHVVEPLDSLLRTSDGGIRYEDLHQVRTILEVEIAGIAASCASDGEIAVLRRLMDEMASAMDAPAIFAERDAAFHGALAEATGNPLLVVLADSVRELLRQYLVMVTPHLDPVVDVMPYHRRIMERVEARDSEGACQAMRGHLNNVMKNHERVFGKSS